MLFLAIILSLGFLSVTGKPAQLRLSHSGYEIISFNENSDDDLKLGTRNSSEHKTGFLNLEKAADPLDEIDDIPIGLQQHKRHYDFQKSNSESKANSDFRRNAIEHESKESSNLVNRHPNLLFTLGIPRRFMSSENQRKGTANSMSESNIKSKNFFDQSSHNQVFWDQDKFVSTPMLSENKNTQYSTANKSKIKSFPFDFVGESRPDDDKTAKSLESEQEFDPNMDKIKSFMFNAHIDHDFSSFPAIDNTASSMKSSNSADHSTDHRDKTTQEKFVPTSMNSKTKDKNSIGINKSKIKSNPFVFERESNHEDEKTKISELEQESFSNLNKIKAIVIDAHRGFDISFDKADSEEKSDKFEPIYEESALPMILGISNRFINHENQKKDSSIIFSPFGNSESNIKSNNIRNDANHASHQSTYVNKKIKDKKYNAAIKSKIKSIPFVFERESNHENEKAAENFESSQKSVSNLNKIKALVLDAHHGFDFSIGKTDSDGKFEKFDTIHSKQKFPILRFPSIAIHNQRSFWLPPKNPAMFSPIYPSGVNFMAGNSHQKSIFPFNLPSSMKNTRNLRFDSKYPTRGKLNADISESRSHEIHDLSRPLDTPLPRKKCDKMKKFAASDFYEFLTKFSDIVLENALHYETNMQIRDSAVKMIELSRRKSTDDEISHFI